MSFSDSIWWPSPWAQHVLHPQVALNILIRIRVTIEQVCWMYLFLFSGCFVHLPTRSVVVPWPFRSARYAQGVNNYGLDISFSGVHSSLGPHSVQKYHEVILERYKRYGPIYKETIAGDTIVHLLHPDFIKVFMS